MKVIHPRSRIRSVAFLTLTLALIFARSATAQEDQADRFQAATTELDSGSFEAGVKQMSSLLEEYPEMINAWITLGRAQRGKSDFQASLDTFTRAYSANPSNPVLAFQLGVAHGYAGNTNEAFEYLNIAKESNSINMTNLAAQPVSENLKNDDRFRALFPTESELADPFVEGTRIIHEWRGENARDQFSWIARNIGDVDGDGVDDLVSSAPTNSEAGPSAGKIYVYSGKGGELLWSALGLVEKGQLGNGVEAAGDVNGDGIPDVIAGAPFAARVLVYDGLSGSVLLDLSGDDPTGGYGNAVRGVGDVNGDGHSDLLIGEPFQIFGAPFNGGTLQHPGKAYLVSGADGSTLLELTGENDADGFGTAVGGETTGGETLFMIGAPGSGTENRGQTYVYRAKAGQSLSSTPHFVAGADETGASMGGMFMSVPGDVNGDGTRDIYASDFSDGSLGPSTGKVYILSGLDGSRIHVLTGSVAGEGFGIGSSDAGDVNGDGHADLVIGAWQHAGSAPSGGKVYVYSGKTGQLMSTITGKVPGETLGFDTTGMGDIDGDGITDFLLTSTWSSANGFQSGRMFIVSGSNSR